MSRKKKRRKPGIKRPIRKPSQRVFWRDGIIVGKTFGLKIRLKWGRGHSITEHLLFWDAIKKGFASVFGRKG